MQYATLLYPFHHSYNASKVTPPTLIPITRKPSTIRPSLPVTEHDMGDIFDLMLQPLTIDFNNHSIEGTGRLLHHTELSTVYCFSHDALQPLTIPANTVSLPPQFLIKIYNDEECFHCEQQALDRLAPLQGKLVPTLYGEIQVPKIRRQASSRTAILQRRHAPLSNRNKKAHQGSRPSQLPRSNLKSLLNPHRLPRQAQRRRTAKYHDRRERPRRTKAFRNRLRRCPSQHGGIGRM